MGETAVAVAVLVAVAASPGAVAPGEGVGVGLSNVAFCVGVKETVALGALACVNVTVGATVEVAVGVAVGVAVRIAVSVMVGETAVSSVAACVNVTTGCAVDETVASGASVCVGVTIAVGVSGSAPPPCASVGSGVTVGALVGGDGVLVGTIGAAVAGACVAMAVTTTGGGADGKSPTILAGTKIVVPARRTPSVKQFTRRSSATEACERAAISLSVSPCLTI